MTVASLWQALDDAGCGQSVGEEDMIDPQRSSAKVNPWTFNERQRRHQRAEERPSLAVDLSIWICESLTSTGLNDHNENPALHLVFSRTMKLLCMGIRLVVVIEGKRRIRAQNSNDEPDKFRRRRSGTSFWKACKQCETMLEFMGVPVVRAKAEGEALCALLNQKGIVDGVISNDGDCLLFGAKVVYTKFSIENLQKGCVMRYDASKLFAVAERTSGQYKDETSDGLIPAAASDETNGRIKLSREDLIAFALLTGSDLAGQGLDKIGHKKAVRFLRQCKASRPLSRESAAIEDLKSWARSVKPIVETEQEQDEGSIADDEEEDKGAKKQKQRCCSCCLHPGTKSSHEKHGCEVCGTEPGEPCYNVSSEEKFVMSLRGKAIALRNPKFDPTLVVNAYLRPNDNQLPVSLAMVSRETLRMDPPRLLEFINWKTIVRGHNLQASQDYVKQSMSQLLVRTELFQNPTTSNKDANSSQGAQGNSSHIRRCARERPIPKEITRKLVQNGIDCYEVCWIMQATVTGKDGDGIDGYEFSTIEHQDMVNRQHPDIVSAFQKNPPKATKPQGDTEMQKRREFLDNMFRSEEVVVQLPNQPDRDKDQRIFNHPEPSNAKGKMPYGKAQPRHPTAHYKTGGTDVALLLTSLEVPAKSKTAMDSKDFEFSSLESGSWLQKEQARDKSFSALKDFAQPRKPSNRERTSTLICDDESLNVQMAMTSKLKVHHKDSNPRDNIPKEIWVPPMQKTDREVDDHVGKDKSGDIASKQTNTTSVPSDLRVTKEMPSRRRNAAPSQSERHYTKQRPSREQVHFEESSDKRSNSKSKRKRKKRRSRKRDRYEEQAKDCLAKADPTSYSNKKVAVVQPQMERITGHANKREHTATSRQRECCCACNQRLDTDQRKKCAPLSQQQILEIDATDKTRAAPTQSKRERSCETTLERDNSHHGNQYIERLYEQERRNEAEQKHYRRDETEMDINSSQLLTETERSYFPKRSRRSNNEDNQRRSMHGQHQRGYEDPRLRFDDGAKAEEARQLHAYQMRETRPDSLRQNASQFDNGKQSANFETDAKFSMEQHWQCEECGIDGRGRFDQRRPGGRNQRASYRNGLPQKTEESRGDRSRLPKSSRNHSSLDTRYAGRADNLIHGRRTKPRESTSRHSSYFAEAGRLEFEADADADEFGQPLQCERNPPHLNCNPPRLNYNPHEDIGDHEDIDDGMGIDAAAPSRSPDSCKNIVEEPWQQPTYMYQYDESHEPPHYGYTSDSHEKQHPGFGGSTRESLQCEEGSDEYRIREIAGAPRDELQPPSERSCEKKRELFQTHRRQPRLQQSSRATSAPAGASIPDWKSQEEDRLFTRHFSKSMSMKNCGKFYEPLMDERHCHEKPRRGLELQQQSRKRRSRTDQITTRYHVHHSNQEGTDQISAEHNNHEHQQNIFDTDAAWGHEDQIPEHHNYDNYHQKCYVGDHRDDDCQKKMESHEREQDCHFQSSRGQSPAISTELHGEHGTFYEANLEDAVAHSGVHDTTLHDVREKESRYFERSTENTTKYKPQYRYHFRDDKACGAENQFEHNMKPRKYEYESENEHEYRDPNEGSNMLLLDTENHIGSESRRKCSDRAITRNHPKRHSNEAQLEVSKRRKQMHRETLTLSRPRASADKGGTEHDRADTRGELGHSYDPSYMHWEDDDNTEPYWADDQSTE
ncbi:GEN homolog 1 [Seminavis robusta]|uniref:GEN homolog 1 n=1 Tax=Seminavis robusta TaxID=568900 RepID=A0A9N8ENX7_9STRA|nr:GEN homolog 1 [Seminavis robusta]|eukprot:Sro1553_g281950.1 GEN homolog 1 (1683) ;mRNA; f:15946-20994